MHFDMKTSYSKLPLNIQQSRCVFKHTADDFCLPAAPFTRQHNNWFTCDQLGGLDLVSITLNLCEQFAENTQLHHNGKQYYLVTNIISPRHHVSKHSSYSLCLE
jgi:hypothetical protein